MAHGKFSYQEKLRRLGLSKKAEEWLEHNPPPPGWLEDRYAWAYTEMPVWLSAADYIDALQSNEP